MKKHLIVKVEKNSIAEEVGIEAGDAVVGINDQEIKDILDYLFYRADEYIELTIEKKNGELWVYEIEKTYDQPIGLEFENPILDQPNQCKNKCIFCFVDQLPQGMRKTLYFKDDDSRLSFLKGNFITLTNLSEEDLMKIIRLRISPINVSVHTTNPELRVEMLKNPKAKDVMKDLKRLTDNGITVNGQIVLCPGYNDGDELKQTIEALYSLGPQFKSLAVVPVGLTQYRDGLVALTPVDRAKAKETIEIIEHYQQRFLADRGTRFVFAADEFYLKADQAIPVLEAYEDFPQIENGVGLIRQFNTQVLNHIGKIDAEFQGTITLVTGISAADNLRDLSRKIMENYDNLTIEVIPIENDFFGEKITVAGLLTGQDLINQLKDRPLGDKVLIPEVMLKDGETIFLDDVTVKTLAQTINREVLVTEVNGKDFLERILKR